MNKDVEVEARPRPLSAGLWTLFSWLRRDDRSSSSESLSSAGSDRTVASFAFLAPDHYRTAPDPLILPPPGPPTDSYKKRVHDRNLRRQYDRDLTLHRKYGLYKSETSSGYDAFSLPPVRRGNADCSNKRDRERRATSECLQRRVVHVPGKRRAPAPPVVGSSASLPRRHTRKRPAPQPPGKLLGINKENLETLNTILTQMNDESVPDKQKSGHNDAIMGCKSEKYCKKETVKDVKIRREKSFLKQIFDSKKRNSAIDTSSVKLLPSISELDKQAAEIIETCKANSSDRNNVKNVLLGRMGSENSKGAGTWICVNCLRKYNSSLVTCLYCLPNQKTQLSGKLKVDRNLETLKGSNSSTQTEKDVSNTGSSDKQCAAEEKQKLKDMLKEMKDSLHKKPKPDLNELKNISASSSKTTCTFTETPTLRVGSKVNQESKPQLEGQSTSSIITKILARQPVVSTHKESPGFAESPLVTQQIAITRNFTKNDNSKMVNKSKIAATRVAEDHTKRNKPEDLLKNEIKQSDSTSTEKTALNTPLRISSLLNPVYIPKEDIANKPSADIVEPTHKPTLNSKPQQIVHKPQKSKVEILTPNNSSKLSSSSSSQPSTALIEKIIKINTKEIDSHRNNSPPTKLPVVAKGESLEPKPDVNIQSKSEPVIPSPEYKLRRIDTQDQHSKRRDLIHQLEQSIAKGDERAAADAAAKLAQLRLSCSVLSFTSQILSQASTSSNNGNAINIDHKSKATPQNCNETGNFNKIVSIKTPDASIVPEKSTNPQRANVLKSEVHRNSATPQAPKSTVKSINKDENDKETPTAVATTNQNYHNNNQENMISIAVLVEDREATRGPVHLRINRQANMGDLRREAETSLALATNLQRWIIGRTLCTEDNTPVASLAAPDFSAPFFLCLVESETKLNTISRTKAIDTSTEKIKHDQDKVGNVYTELVQLEQQALVPNAESFECEVCMEEYVPGTGVVLRECVHIFCKECLSNVIRHCEEPNVPCPAMGCRGMLQEREVRAIVSPQDYERWLARGLAAAESGTRNAFHCRTRDCTGWAMCEPGVQRFPCPVCKCINCVKCQAIHEGVTCGQHQAKLKEAANADTGLNQTDEVTRTLLNSLINKGEALECPECKAIITKKWGCDWVKCSACKTEICWVTRGRRWGPAGRGDTSGGCRCGVDGKRCHPSCGYCH